MILANPDYRMWWREEKIFPSGAGFFSGLWRSSLDCTTVGLHFVTSDDPDNGDTGYAVSDDIGVGGPTCTTADGPGQHSFQMQDPAALLPSDMVLSLTPHAVVRKSGASACTFRSGVRQAGSNAFGSNSTLSTAYINFGPSKFATKPAGGDWDLSSVNGTEAIIESVTTGTGPQEQRVTQAYVVVEYVIMPAALMLALTGNSGAGAAGILIPGFSRAVSGNAAAAALGNLTPGVAKILTGNLFTGSPGNASPAFAIPVGGMAMAGAVGTVVYGASGAAAPTLQQITRISINRRGVAISIKGGR